MKTKIKRHSRSVISVILALSMLVSCMMVGLIATDAARVTDSGAVGASVDKDVSVGADNYYYRGNKISNWAAQEMTSLGDNFYYLEVTTTEESKFKITSQTDWNGTNRGYTDVSSLLNASDMSYDIADDGTNDHNIVDKNTGTHYVMFFKGSNQLSTFVWFVQEDPSTHKYYKGFAQAKISGSDQSNKYGKVFFNTTAANWTGITNIYLVIGHMTYTKAYEMTALSGTDLYACNLSDSAGFGDARYYTFIGTSSALDAKYTSSSINESFLTMMNTNNNIKYTTAFYTVNSDSGSIKLNSATTLYDITSTTSGDYCDFTVTANANTDAGVYYNKLQTVNVYTDGVESSDGGSVTFSGKKIADTQFSTDNLLSNQNWPALTSSVTITASPAEGYVFNGFYSDAGLRTQITEEDTLTYTVEGTREIYASFRESGDRYYVTSAGKTDSDKGFSNDIWKARDLQLAETGANTGIFSKTIEDVPMGWYRFKVNKFTDGAFSTYFGGAHTEYTNDTQTNNRIPADKRSAENNGNAKFYLKGKSNIIISYNSTTGKVTVTAAAPTTSSVTYKYYIVGMASDGTEGMFGNVWADNWTEFSSADEMTLTPSSTYEYTLEKTDFDGTYGTYTYEAVKVGSDGSVVYYPGEKVTKTVDVTKNAKKVKFTLTLNSSEVYTNLTADVTNKSNDSDDYYDTIFVNENKDNAKKLFYAAPGSNWNNWGDTGLQAYKKQNSSSQNVYYFRIPVSSYVNTSEHGFMLTTGENYYDCISGSSSSVNITVDLASRATTYLSKGNNNFNGNVNDNNQKDKRYHYAWVKFKESSYKSQFKYIVLAYNSSTKTYTFDVYGDAVGGGGGETYSNYVDIYAKNGNLRDSNYNRFTNLANTDVMSIMTPDGIVYTKESHSGWSAATGGSWTTNQSGYDSNYDLITNVPVDSKVVLRTTLSNTKFRTVDGKDEGFWETHYLKAYSFNGYTYELHSPDKATDVKSGEDTTAQYYEETWTVEAINAANMKKSTRSIGGNSVEVGTVEITPIYYLKDNKYTKTFFIDGYEGLLQNKWGTLLCVYPYYKGSSNKANAFGGYPGQPMLYWGGKYQMEIPLTVDGTATGKEVKGLTMHNAYWDLLHRKLDTACADGHCQTYDYDDFYKIYKEKNADTIFFRYKYFPKKNYTYNGETITAGHDNYGDNYSYDSHDFAKSSGSYPAKSASDFTGSDGNGVEIVTDYYGRQVDVFGTILTDSQKSTYSGTQTKELLLVSTGYKNTYVGHYATEWAVYAPSTANTNGSDDAANKFIGYISSSMLYLNNIGRVSQYTGGTNTGDGQMSSSKYKSTYEHLKKYYEGVPALISYEKEIHNYSLDQADRSDGKWYYSTTSDKLTANIKIQTTAATTNVTLLGNHNWTDSEFTKAGAGNVNNTDANDNTAYFTNTTPDYLYGQVTARNILSDPSKQFTFQAYSGDGYKFVGWVRYSVDDGKYYEISNKDGLGSSNISANDTYIARFMPAAKGSLVVSHNIVNDGTYKGSGTKYLKVEILDASNNVKKTFEKNDGTDIDVSDYIKEAYSTYKLRITLTTEPDEDCAVAARTVALGAESKYDRYRTDSDTSNLISADLPKDTGVTYTNTIVVDINDVYDSTDGVTALRYTTKLTKTEINYAYRIVYTYTSRFWGQQTYTVEGFIDEQQAAKYFSGVKNIATLNKSFIISSTPYEKNFRQKIDWNYDSMTNNAAGEQQSVTIGTETKEAYLMTATVGSTNTLDDTVRAEFFLPYKYNEETKAETGLDLYNAEGTKLEGTEIAFDEQSYESSTVKSRAGHLFNYDNSIPDIPTSGQTTEDFPKLIKAAPYVLKKGVWNSTDSKWEFKSLSGGDFHYKDTYSTKEYDGNLTFVIGDKYYYYGTDPTASEETHPATTGVDLSTTTGVSWFDDDGNVKPYDYAVLDSTNNELYFFNVEDSVCTGYSISTKGKEIDGIIQNTNDEMTTAPSDTSYTFYKKFNFSRWDIYTADGKTYVASSFANSRAFNYSGYEDYIVIPVYNQKESNSGCSTTITFMGDTRNQWNMGGLGHYKEGAVAENGEESTGMTDCDTQGDKLLIDFGLAFNNAGTKLTPSDKAGFIIERLEKLDTTAGTSVAALKDSTAITNLSYYEKKYATGDRAWDETTIKNAASSYATNGTKTSLTNRVATIYRACTISKLDNFDRMQYTNTFTNKRDAGETDQAQYIYRATSYLKVNGKDIVVSEPIYFTLYDLASR